MPNSKRSTGYIIRSKVTPPQLPAFVVPRTRILARFESPRRGRLVKLSAPAGYGKTLAMVQMADACRRQGLAVTWLSLDEADNDISRFLQTFLAAVNEMPEATLTRIETRSNASIADGIMAYFDALAHPVSVFMDGLDALENTVVRDIIIRGIASIPAGSVVVVGTRVEPSWGMSGFRASGQLTEIGVEALRFSREEVAALFYDKLGVQLGAEHLDALHTLTEGWPSALWFAWLAINEGRDIRNVLRDISGGGKALESFLADEVMALASSELHDFLLGTSPVDEIDAEIAAELTPGQNVAECLSESERLNLLFRYYDEAGAVYRLNSLLRDSFYQSFCRLQPAEVVAEAHSRACDYFVKKGRTARAIRQAISAGRFDTAIALLNDNLYPLLARGRMRYLADVFEQLEAAGKLKDPLHHVLRAWCVTFIRGPAVAHALIEHMDEATMADEARDCLLALSPLILALRDRVAEAGKEARLALERISGNYPYANAMLHQVACQTSIILGDHQAACKSLNQARSEALSGSGAFGMVLAESAEVMLDIMSGRLRQATARIQMAEEAFRKSRMHRGQGVATSSVFHAVVLYESGQLAEARSILERNVSLMRDLGPPDALISGHTLFSRLAYRSGNVELALEVLTQLEADGYRLDLPRVIASAKLELANLRLCLGDYSGAVAKLEEAREAFDWREIHNRWWAGNDTLYPDLVTSRLHIRTGKASKAIPVLKEELKHAERQSRTRRVLKLRILLAEALFLTGEKKPAMRVMIRAVQFAASEGFVSTFREEGGTVGSLYLEAQQRLDTEQGDGEQDESQAPTAAPYMNQMGEKVTPKELAVLQHLAKGLSNDQIAEAMFVSESTVRSHLRSINVKLNAKNRTQALVMAREMGIVS